MESPQSDDVYRVVFTALDGTLLDSDTHSWEAADDAIEQLVDSEIPLVFCSSMTRAEQLAIQEDAGIGGPIIVENGSAVFFPPGYFRDSVPGARPAGSTYGSAEELDLVELGIPADRVRELLDEIRRDTGLHFRRCSEMSVKELAETTGLDSDRAARAAEREFSDTLEENLSEADWDDFFLALAERGLACIEGDRFTSVFSALTDKGRGVRLVTELLRREVAPIETIGIGSNAHDVTLLDAVDRPFLVQQSDGSFADIEVDNLEKIEGVGPEGFRRVIDRLGL